jgi:hypothetical protein
VKDAKQNLNRSSDTKIEFTATLSKDNNNPQDVKGFITKEAIYLENQLISNLSQLTPNGKNNINQAKKFEYVGNTFDEIIKRDKAFGSLLLKIKSAYHSYVESL